MKAGQARMQESIHVKVVGLAAGPQGARSSLPAFLDISFLDNCSECGRNAELAGLRKGGTNDQCPGLSANLGSC